MPRRALPGPLDASEEARDGTEWGVFGVPGPLHGARGFSPLRTLLPIRAFSFPGATERRCGFRRGHRLSPQPVYPFHLALRRGIRGGHSFRFHLAERQLRGKPYDFRLGGLRGDGPRSTVVPGSSGLPEGGGIPPGGYPVAGWSIHRWMALAASTSFSRARGSAPNAAGEPGEGRLSLLADVPISGLSAVPNLLDSLAARVVLRRWRPSPQARSPYRPRPPASPKERGFVGRPPIRRCTGRRSAPQRIGPQAAEAPNHFRGSRPLRKQASLGASYVPRMLVLLTWFSGFARFCNLAFPAEHITIRASKNASTLFFTFFVTFFLDIFDI